tara:strand:- start:3311 stop:3859 length:549 start_codon:yes stop_codon:yes gene_type:complete
MDHLEAIVELKNIIDPTFCEKVKMLIDVKASKKLGSGGKTVKNIHRQVRGYSLSLDTPTDIFYWNYIKQEVEKVYYHYKIKFPQMASDRISQIDVLKYTPGCKYGIHTDHYSSTARSLSVIINLNNEYEGGDLVFTDQREKEIKRFKLNERSIVFFPSNFLYPHTIEPITKGTRYSIVLWLQ